MAPIEATQFNKSASLRSSSLNTHARSQVDSGQPSVQPGRINKTPHVRRADPGSAIPIPVPKNLGDIFGDAASTCATSTPHKDDSPSFSSGNSCPCCYYSGDDCCSCTSGSTYRDTVSSTANGESSSSSFRSAAVRPVLTSSFQRKKKKKVEVPRNYDGRKPKKHLRYRLATEESEESADLEDDLGPAVTFSPWRKKQPTSPGEKSYYSSADDLGLGLHLGDLLQGDLDDEICYFLMRASEEKIHQKMVALDQRNARRLPMAAADKKKACIPKSCWLMNDENSQFANAMKPHGLAILGPHLWEVLLQGIRVYAFLGLSSTAISRMAHHLFFLDQHTGHLKLMKIVDAPTKQSKKGAGKIFPLENLIEIDRGDLIHDTILQDQTLRKSNIKHVVALWTNNAQDPLVCLSTNPSLISDLVSVLRFLQFYHGMSTAKLFDSSTVL